MSKPTALNKILSFLYLSALLFGLAFLVMLPFQLYEVHDVRTNGKQVNVEIVESYVYYRSNKCSLKIAFITPNGQQVTIGDALPGDIATCGKNRQIAGRYANGKSYPFIQVRDTYYVGQGEYWWACVIALIGSLPYLYLLYSIYKTKRKGQVTDIID